MPDYSKRPDPVDELDNYGLDDDLWKTPSPPGSPKKKDDGLGIDEQVSVKKTARAPAVKLDEERLLSEAGIPTLRKRAGKLKLKGKGHEFSDAARLLTFYQMWLDDLYPKAKFADALVMVEKAGHKRKLAAARTEWLNESRPKETGDDDLSLPPLNDGQKTPTRAMAPEDEDIYGSTPSARRPQVATTTTTQNNDMPDEDDLDALMAEAEAQDNGPAAAPTNGVPEDDLDDLDALMAESEAHPNPTKPAAPVADPSFDEDEEAMREMEGW